MIQCCWSHFIYYQHKAKNLFVNHGNSINLLSSKIDDSNMTIAKALIKTVNNTKNWVAPLTGSPLESIKYSTFPNDRLHHRMWFSNGVELIESFVQKFSRRYPLISSNTFDNMSHSLWTIFVEKFVNFYYVPK